tara:strand:+ start:106 stop:447 length:342 start_codon:yes stop_codon:yes gene_type:complete
MPKTEEEQKEYKKNWYEINKEKYQTEEYKKQKSEYNKSEAGLKSGRINHWKRTGKDVGHDWDEIHDTYICTDFCNECNTPLTDGSKKNKCLSRNLLTGEIYGVICKRCCRSKM